MIAPLSSTPVTHQLCICACHSVIVIVIQWSLSDDGSKSLFIEMIILPDSCHCIAVPHLLLPWHRGTLSQDQMLPMPSMDQGLDCSNSNNLQNHACQHLEGPV